MDDMVLLIPSVMNSNSPSMLKLDVSKGLEGDGPREGEYPVYIGASKGIMACGCGTPEICCLAACCRAICSKTMVSCSICRVVALGAYDG